MRQNKWDKQNETGRLGHAEQEKKGKTAKASQPGHYCQGKTTSIRLPEKDDQDRTANRAAWTEWPEKKDSHES
jgi:hypothetical protein